MQLLVLVALANFTGASSLRGNNGFFLAVLPSLSRGRFVYKVRVACAQTPSQPESVSHNDGGTEFVALGPKQCHSGYRGRTNQMLINLQVAKMEFANADEPSKEVALFEEKNVQIGNGDFYTFYYGSHFRLQIEPDLRNIIFTYPRCKYKVEVNCSGKRENAYKSVPTFGTFHVHIEGIECDLFDIRVFKVLSHDTEKVVTQWEEREVRIERGGRHKIDMEVPFQIELKGTNKLEIIDNYF